MKRLTYIFSLLFLLTLVSCASTCKEKVQEPVNWLEAPSLKEAFEGKFEIGFAIPLNKLEQRTFQEGLAHHASTFTMENEMKPDPIFGVYSGKRAPSTMEIFEASNGLKIEVPKNYLVLSYITKSLQHAKNNNLKMRGHVLVWHSQTPGWFFKENYRMNGALVDKDTMTARQEWYIKSVLECVKKWEVENNNDERIIHTWDVVNEAASDSNSGIRTNDSNWYNIYKSDEYIVNAFRFANKYAPKDVKLCYNDYNEYMGHKTQGILNIVKAIQDASNDEELPTRIDVIGMQSHMGSNFPNPTSYEVALKKFIATGLDIHVTELDLGDFINADDVIQANLYASYFSIFVKYAKTPTKNGIENVTFWGVRDIDSWRSNGGKQFPLIFDANFNCKKSFFKILETSKY